MSGNPFAGTARVGWMEFWSHLKSPRLIILVILFALLVFAVSYGLSQSQSFELGTSMTLFGHPAIRNESGVDHYLVFGWFGDIRGTPVAGVPLSVFRQTPSPFGTWNMDLLENVSTNATGWVSVDVGTSFPAENVSFALESTSGGLSPSEAYVAFDPSLLNRTFTLGELVTTYSSGPLGSETIFYTHVMTINGYPASGADVYLNDTLVGHPDANGYFSTTLQTGLQNVTIAYQGYEESYTEMGQTNPGPTYENGADSVLLTMTSFFGVLLPVAAIAISFDTIARERAQGSLELLLAQRVRREGILVGKFLGAFASVALPITVVLLAGVAVLTAVSGKAPTGSFVAAVVVASLFLVAVYILLMLLFSTLAKSVGTAVVFGVVLWLFFNLFFSFVTLFLVVSSGGSFFNAGSYGLLITVQLFDPNTVFTMLVSLAVPMTGGSAGLVPTEYVSTSTVIAAAVLWLVVLALLVLAVFRKKAEG